jgi:tRNA A37 methylthiotransferase MiaB
MRVHLQMLGCRLNEAELQGWARDLVAAGHEIAPHPDEADLVVLNTCAVTAEAARKSRQQIRRARRRNPTARLVVTGCYGTLERNEVQSQLGVDQVIDNRDKARLVQLVDPLCGFRGRSRYPRRSLAGRVSVPSSRSRTGAATVAPTASSPWRAATR